jgi:ADP-heptose:LPS heptosyltransferase
MVAASARPGSLLGRLGERARIAVLRTGRIGDLVVLAPALGVLRMTLPQAHVTLLVNRRALPLAERLTSVDEVVEVPDLAAMQRLGRGEADAEMHNLLDDLRGRRFDLALQCAGGGETTNAFVLALGARLTAGQQWPDAPRLDLWMPYQRTQPDVLRLLDIMELIGTPRGGIDYSDIQVTPRDEAEIAGLEIDLEHAVGVAPGAGSGARCWPPERFAAVLNATAVQAAVLLGTAEEASLATAVKEQTHCRVVDLTGKTSFGGLLAVLSRLRLLLANDSAPAHLAHALGVPSVVVFGSAHPTQWAAPGRIWDRAVADETAPCRRFSPPCGCPDDARALCLAAVGVEPVVEQTRAVLSLLAQTPKTHWPHRVYGSATPSGSMGSRHGASHVRSGMVVARSWWYAPEGARPQPPKRAITRI